MLLDSCCCVLINSIVLLSLASNQHNIVNSYLIWSFKQSINKKRKVEIYKSKIKMAEVQQAVPGGKQVSDVCLRYLLSELLAFANSNTESESTSNISILTNTQCLNFFLCNSISFICNLIYLRCLTVRRERFWSRYTACGVVNHQQGSRP